jgi:peptidyl-tRNA hydrolase, PTH1 family
MVSWLIAGLGNPDPEYELSPHNLGFMVIDLVAEQCGAKVKRKDSGALVGQAQLEGQAVLLVKPQTYMNLSGHAVAPLLAKNELGPGNLIVVYDDHNLPWGSLRIRPRGSAGGHHGMESVIAAIGTDEFVRVRLGINPGAARAEVEYLLKPLRRGQLKELEDFLGYAAQAVTSIVSEGAEKAMTRFNRRAQGEKEEE